MHSVLGALLAVVVAAVPFTPSLPGPEPEAARGHHIPVRGELVIGPQGEVQRVEVAAGPPSAVRHFVRGAVGGWRFEPVLEAGQAATVRTGFALSVLARPEGDGFELTIEGAWFGSEHPLAAGQATPRMPARATRTGIGGLVVVAARLAADGRVEAVHAYHSGLEAAPISTMDWLVPHQANLRIIEATAKRMRLPMEKVVLTVADHGNTSAASIPLALSVANAEGRFKPGDVLVAEAIGGGLAWGSVVLRW